MVDKGEVVRLYEAGLTQEEVAQRVGRTQGHISRILNDYGVETRFTKWWEENEIEFLKQNYPPGSEDEKCDIIEKLCVEGRTWKGVRDKAESLGLTRPQDEYRRSEENRKVLERAAKRIVINLDHPLVGYIVGILDTDGYTNKSSQIGLEVKDQEFIKKAKKSLEALGFNPKVGQSPRSDDKYILYACSQQFVQWYENELDRREFTEEQKRLYLEAVYEGDGTIHMTGYCMICSTDPDFKQFISEFLEREFGFSSRIWQDGIALVPQDQRERLLQLIDPVVKGPDYYDDNR